MLKAMTNLTAQVLSTVNAPYVASLSAYELACKIVDPKSAHTCDASVFAFFSEVSPHLQNSFIEAMGIDRATARKVASEFSAMSGIPLALAA